MSLYQYDVPTKLPLGVNHSRLILDLKRQFGNNFTLQHVGDTLNIHFESSLNGSEEETLNNTIDNHDSTQVIRRQIFFVVNPFNYTTSHSRYTTLAAFGYGGSFHVGEINYIDLVAKISGFNKTYDLRVIDNSNGNVLCEKNDLNNNDFEIIDMGTIYNIPTESTVLEIHARVNGFGRWSRLFFTQATIYYNNE